MTDLLASMELLAETRSVQFDPTDFVALRSLEDASNFIRAYTRQIISVVEDDVVELRGNWSDDLWLPQKPVTEVSAISVLYRGSLEPEVVDLTTWDVPRRGLLSRCGGWGGPRATIGVTYTHGYEVIPADIVTACLSLAGRLITSPGGGAVISESIGSYSVTYADPTPAAGGVGLSGTEATILNRYRNAAMAES